MKKILFMLLFMGTVFAVQAQTTPLRVTAVTTTSYGIALDTVNNTEAIPTTPLQFSYWYHGLTAQVIVKKISGTVGGSMALQGSMAGTEWTTIGSAATPGDTSANYSFNTTVAWKYYRVLWTGTGTMSASFRTTFLAY